MSLSIQPQDVASKKQIGHLDDKPVYQLDLKGGLFVIIAAKGPSLEILGTGAHQVVAKHVAKKIHPRLVITELMKSEEIDINHYQRLIPYYLNMTLMLSKLNG